MTDHPVRHGLRACRRNAFADRHNLLLVHVPSPVPDVRATNPSAGLRLQPKLVVAGTVRVRLARNKKPHSAGVSHTTLLLTRVPPIVNNRSTPTTLRHKARMARIRLQNSAGAPLTRHTSARLCTVSGFLCTGHLTARGGRSSASADVVFTAAAA